MTHDAYLEVEDFFALANRAVDGGAGLLAQGALQLTAPPAGLVKLSDLAEMLLLMRHVHLSDPSGIKSKEVKRQQHNGRDKQKKNTHTQSIVMRGSVCLAKTAYLLQSKITADASRTCTCPFVKGRNMPVTRYFL